MLRQSRKPRDRGFVEVREFSRGEEQQKQGLYKHVRRMLMWAEARDKAFRLVAVSLRLNPFDTSPGLGRAKGPPRSRARSFRELKEIDLGQKIGDKNYLVLLSAAVINPIRNGTLRMALLGCNSVS